MRPALHKETVLLVALPVTIGRRAAAGLFLTADHKNLGPARDDCVLSSC